MDIREEVIFQINASVEQCAGPWLIIITMENGVGSHCFQHTGRAHLETKLKLLNWKSNNPVGIVLVDPDIYDYDEYLSELEHLNIFSVFHYFPETSRLLQFQNGFHFPFKLIANDIGFGDNSNDLNLLGRQLKERINRIIEYLEMAPDLDDNILQQCWLLISKYKKSSPILEHQIGKLENEILMLQTMCNQLETKIELN